jgi:cephalosporin hydroxylase
VVDIEASLEAAARQYAEGCVKTWEDLARYEEVLKRCDPDLIIECGTFSGKSALWFAKHSAARIITIDTDPAPRDEDVRQAWGKLFGQIHFIMGSSTDPVVTTKVRDFAHDARRVMVVLDSDHGREHVLRELKMYGPLVTPGQYLVVEDTLLHYMPEEERAHYDGDPLEAVRTWQPRRGWQHDDQLEEMFAVTQFPRGWWRYAG